MHQNVKANHPPNAKPTCLARFSSFQLLRDTWSTSKFSLTQPFFHFLDLACRGSFQGTYRSPARRRRTAAAAGPPSPPASCLLEPVDDEDGPTTDGDESCCRLLFPPPR